MTQDRELEQWIMQIGQGDTQALSALYDRCSRAVYAYALSILRLPDAADDVSQDAFLKIWRSASAYTPQGKPLAWVMRIVRNLCLDELRRPATVELTDGTVRPETAVSDDNAVIEREYLHKLCAELLTDEERDIVFLRTDADLSHAEIAQVLGISAAAVRWKYTYALKKLRKRLVADTAV